MWDSKNKLLSFTEGSTSTSYTYNPDGIRTGKTENGVNTHYIVDSNRDYAQVLEEVENNLTRVQYTYGHDLINQQRNHETSFYHYDGLGSTRGLSNSEGSFTDSYHYEAFGEIQNQTGSTDNDYLFTGEQFDEGLNQYYLRARYYDQNTGRFTQMDSWEGNNSDPVTLHKYLYANANPGSMIDPSGNFSIGSMMSAVNISSTLAVASAGLSGYSIGSGGVAIYEGRYADGALDITLGFMGTGVAVGGYKMIKYTFGPVNRLIRQKYIHFIATELPKQISLMKTQGRSAKDIADTVVMMRNSIKIETRALMKADGVGGEMAEYYLRIRNNFKYGNPIGPTLKEMMKDGKNYEEVVEGALRSSEKFNRLAAGAIL